jgi:L-fuconate dehydratase
VSVPICGLYKSKNSITTMSLLGLLGGYTFSCSDWEVYDTRIKIPPLSSGSDAINSHTQYSNPLLLFSNEGVNGVGISFTLGDGNDIMCACVRKILNRLEGVRLRDLLSADGLLFDALANPLQLRWLSPNAGVAYMASGAILNTLLDWGAKKMELPLWKALSLEPSENLMRLCSVRQYSPYLSQREIVRVLDSGLKDVGERIIEVESQKLPVYFTTWLGTSTQEIINNIGRVHLEKGISQFKIKVGRDFNAIIERIDAIQSAFSGKNLKFCADANQTLDYMDALSLCKHLSERGFIWLEEPFAPDNPRLHAKLRHDVAAEGMSIEIVTGENCPNAHVSIEFIQSGACDRFQIDACRVLSFCDLLPILVAARLSNVPVVPHAGGAGLDELVLHLSAFNYCRIGGGTTPSSLLTEHVGFCSKYFDPPCQVTNGRALVPKHSGYLGDVSKEVYESLHQKSDIKWLTY